MAELRNAGLQNSRRKELLPQSLNPQLQFLVSKTVHIRREPLLLRVVEVECPDRLIFAQDQNSRELLVVDSIKLCFDSVDHQELDPLVHLFEKLALRVAGGMRALTGAASTDPAPFLARASARSFQRSPV